MLAVCYSVYMNKELIRFQRVFRNVYAMLEFLDDKQCLEARQHTLKHFLGDYTNDLVKSGKTRHFVNKFMSECLTK